MDVLSMTQPFVRAECLARHFGSGDNKVVALEPTTFSIERGAHIALLGPSGSGKSTLLNLIAGLDEPSSGTISWPGIGSRQMLRPLAVGMIHQFAALIPTLNVAENVALPLRLGHRLGEDEAVRDAIAAVDLTAFSDRLPDELSGGQAQRAGIARALVHGPALLLADEPTGQLDHATGQAMLSAILDHARRRAITFVVATHDQAIAERVETLWQMEHGRLISRKERVLA
jgi:putative ABC transport system ATP-binding protein/lipoprotein-releasing system ATP-binding protein